MRRIIACGLAASGLLTTAGAQPFAWLPGSTVLPADETGDRVVIVNLADGTIESDVAGNPTAPAWRFTEDFAGKDPFIPSFSPNGEFVYLVNGGKGDAPVNEPDGHIRLYNAVEVIQAFRGGTVPAPDSHIQEITIPAGGSDAVEPLCFTISASDPTIGDRGYFIDAAYELLYTFDINADSTLTQVAVDDTGKRPSPIWLHPTTPFGFFCSFDANDVPQVNIVDTSDGPTAGTILRSIPLSLPTPNDVLEIAYASCTLPMSSDEVLSNTLVPPSALPINQFPANELWIFSGWVGLQASPLFGSTPSRVNDPFRVFKLDIQTGDAETMDFVRTTSNDWQYEIDPANRFVVFPPFIQLNDNGNGLYAHIGGSTVIKPDGTVDALLQPTGASDNNWFPTIGEMFADRNEIWIGSASEASLSGLLNETYTPAFTNSKIYKYEFDSINKADVNLAAVANIDRSVSFVAGRTNSRVVIGASDTFMIDLTDDLGNPTNVRDSQVVLLDPADPTPQDSLITVDLQLVAGAYGQQPFIQIPEPGEPDIAVVDLGDLDPVTVSETIVLANATVGENVARTFRVDNNGTAALSPVLAAPTNGFTVGEGLNANIGTGSNDNFTINVPTGSAGFFSTGIQITSNDPDTPSFTFTLQITVSQGGGNQAPTDIDLAGSTANEAAAQGTVVGTLSTTDPNVGDTHTYTVTGENNNTKAIVAFAIDGSNLVVNDASQLDVTVSELWNVTIRSTDQGSLFHEKVFPITIAPNVVVVGGGEAVRFLGDSNGDAFVNASDFTLTRNNIFDDYGCRDYRGVGDSNGDGFVNASDFTITRNNIFNDYTELDYEQALEVAPCP